MNFFKMEADLDWSSGHRRESHMGTSRVQVLLLTVTFLHIQLTVDLFLKMIYFCMVFLNEGRKTSKNMKEIKIVW